MPTKFFSSATKSLSRTISKTVQAGEDLVIGKPPSRTTSTGSGGSGGGGNSVRSLRGVPRTISRGNSGGKRSPKAQDFDANPPENVRIFCSDMYTHEFVADAVKKVEKDKDVTSLELEDLIQRNDEEATKMVVDLLVENAMVAKSKKTAGKYMRIWTQIVFTDAIMDAASYKEYTRLKSVFMTTMTRRLALKGVGEDLPIRFEAKIELHTMLDVYGVTQLLKTIQDDDNIKSVRFPGFRGSEKEIPGTLASMADPETMEWKHTTEILCRYRRKPKVGKPGETNPACAVVKQCAQALEKMVFSASVTGSLTYGPDMTASVIKKELGPMPDESTTEASLLDHSESSEVKVTKLSPSKLSPSRRRQAMVS